MFLGRRVKETDDKGVNTRGLGIARASSYYINGGLDPGEPDYNTNSQLEGMLKRF